MALGGVSNRRRNVVIGVLGALALCCMGGAGTAAYLIFKPNPDEVDWATYRIHPDRFPAVAAAAHLSLPEGAKWIDGYRYDWIDGSICARFTIPRSSFEAFVRDSHLAAPQPGLRPELIVHPNHPASKHDKGWDANSPASVSGLEDADGNVARSVMFDLDRPDIITVYLIFGRYYSPGGSPASKHS
jgi:hypothetical protein